MTRRNVRGQLIRRRVVFLAERGDDALDRRDAVAARDDLVRGRIENEQTLGKQEHGLAGDRVLLQAHARGERGAELGIERLHSAQRW